MQNNFVSAMMSNREREGGLMGKLLGINIKNAAIHSGLIICIILLATLLIGFFVTYTVNEGLCRTLLETIIPVISLSIGYIFGKGDN